MLTKTRVVGRVSVLEDGRLEVREDTIFAEDGVELSRTYHRAVLLPGEDVSAQPQIVRDLAGFLWTPDVIAAAQLALAETGPFPPVPPVRQSLTPES